MKFLKENLVSILIVIITVFVVIQIKSCTDKTPVNEKIIRNEEKLINMEQNRVKDSVNFVLQLQVKDDTISILKQQFLLTTPKLQQLKKDYEKIPHTINNLDNNELLQRANSFKPE